MREMAVSGPRVGVEVGVSVGVGDGVSVAVGVGVAVAVGVGVLVEVAVGAGVFVSVGVTVAVRVSVGVGDDMGEAVGVAVEPKREMVRCGSQATKSALRPARRRKVRRDNGIRSEDPGIGTGALALPASNGDHLGAIAAVFVEIVAAIDGLDLESSMTEE
jgi:hypothetical protein